MRNPAYLDWLRDQPCITCGRLSSWGDRNQASHVGVSNFKIKPPDNQAIPQCGKCHSLFEYHKNKFTELTGTSLPSLEDCQYYFSLFCQKTGFRPQSDDTESQD